MKKLFLAGILCFIVGSPIFPQTYSLHPYLSGGFSFGYNNGLGVQSNLTVSNFAMDFPVSIKLGFGYTNVDPGNPAEARAMFVNNATNGVPEKTGTVWDFSMDFLYPIKLYSLKRSSFYIGPRYSMFYGDFSFIDGNEVFTISSDQWGFGFGLNTAFSLGTRLDLVFTTGFDYYFLSTIEGHDTSYNPDGEIINGNNNYTYKDVDKAINQPKFLYRLMMGFNYYF